MSSSPAPRTRLRGALRRAGFTSAGSWALLVGVLVLALGLVLGWVELRLAGVLVLGVLLAAVVFTLGRQSFRMRLDLAGNRVVVGQRAQGRLVVTNVSSGRILPTRVDLPVGGHPASFLLPSMAGHARHQEIFTLPTERRAHLLVGPARSVRGDPFSLMAREVTWTDTQELFVHPRTVALVNRGGGFVQDLEGRPTEELSRSDVAFHALREYAPGDDRRHVHWLSSARTQKLMVRQFNETRRSVVAIGLDTSAAAYAGELVDGTSAEFEDGVSVAASVAVATLREENALTVLAGDLELNAGSVGSVLDGLSGVEPVVSSRPDPETVALPLTRLARALRRTCPDASVVVLVTGSAVSPIELRRAAAGFGADAQVVAVRLGCEFTVRTFGPTTTIELPGLDDLPRAMRRAGVPA